MVAIKTAPFRKFSEFATNRPIIGGRPDRVPTYATFSPGVPTIPDGSQGTYSTEHVNPLRSLIDLVFENWMPFSAWIMSRLIPPRAPVTAFESPYDLDGGERITRYGDNPSAGRPFPYPWQAGAVSGFMPMLDQYSMAWAWGKPPSGPGVLTPIPIPWDAQYPTMPKVQG